MNFKKILISLSLVVALFVPAVSSAASILSNDIINAANCSKTNPCTLNTFVALGVSVAKYILGIVGALTLLMFIYGGLVWILSGGSSDKVQKGKDIIIGSIVGLLIVFSSYMIISWVTNTMLGATGDFKFTGSAPKDTKIETKVAGADCKARGVEGHCANSFSECGVYEQKDASSDCGAGKVCCWYKDEDVCAVNFPNSGSTCVADITTCQNLGGFVQNITGGCDVKRTTGICCGLQ